MSSTDGSTQARAGSTELALIHAAIEHFGRDGFAAVSTRTLADSAGANVSSIKYYFGGKDELYRAAVLHVVDVVAPRIEMAISVLDSGGALAGQDPVRQATLIRQLIGAMMEAFLADRDIPFFMPFVLREFFVPGKHFDAFYEAVPRKVHTLFTNIVAMVEGSDPEDEDTILRAHGVLGQIMIFHVGRQILLKRLDWDDFDEARIERITRHVQALVLDALGLPDPEAEDG